MRYVFTILFLFCFTPHLKAQDVQRVLINGKIIVDSDDKEGITIFNSSSNKGTITNERGEFSIYAALNDVLEFSALQFKDFVVTIDKNVIASHQITVILVEDVNKLDEVIILPFNLTGNLTVDSERVKTFNPNMDAIYFGIKNYDEFDFSDDYKTRAENTAMHSQSQTMEYGLNVVNVVGLLLKPLFKSNNNNKSNTATSEYQAIYPFKTYYSNEFVNEYFNIPLEKVDEFVLYLESNGLDYSLLKQGKEIEFLEFVNQKSKLYLNDQTIKN